MPSSSASCCCVPGCKTGYTSVKVKNRMKGKKNCSIFSPRTEEMLLKWREVIPRTNKALSKSNGVCELHFREDEVEKYYVTTMRDGTVFRMRKGKATLRIGAVPSIFPSHQETAISSANRRQSKGKEETLADQPKLQNTETCSQVIPEPTTTTECKSKNGDAACSLSKLKATEPSSQECISCKSSELYESCEQSELCETDEQCESSELIELIELSEQCETDEECASSKLIELSDQGATDEQCGSSDLIELSEQCETDEECASSKLIELSDQGETDEQCGSSEPIELSEQCETDEQYESSELTELSIQCEPCERVKQCELSELAELSDQSEPYEPSSTEFEEITESKASSFQSLKQQLNTVVLPRGLWFMHVLKNRIFWICLQNNSSVIAKRVVLLHDLSVEIFLEEKRLTLANIEHIESIDEMSELLQRVAALIPCKGVVGEQKSPQCIGYVLTKEQNRTGPQITRCTACRKQRRSLMKRPRGPNQVKIQQEKRRKVQGTAQNIIRRNLQVKKKVAKYKKIDLDIYNRIVLAIEQQCKQNSKQKESTTARTDPSEKDAESERERTKY